MSAEKKTAFLDGAAPDGTRLRFALTADRHVVGRQGDILLLDVAKKVSRMHASIEWRDGDWLLSDMGSHNGTFVNGATVQRHFLKAGDVLRFGDYSFKVVMDGEAADAANGVTYAETEKWVSPPRETTGLVGRSAALKNAMALASRAAKSDVPVIVYGESGTGKELFARLVFEESNRRTKKFLVANCSAIEQNLIGSTLFGYEKGAFTGADRLKKGLFEEADGGTLFLDEIGDISPDVQVKLLRVLQEGEFMRVGGTESIHVDVRVITATNRDLRKAIAEGKFREDLYYRLNVIPINLPPLRERGGDVEDLVRHFVTQFGGPTRSVSPEAMAALAAYRWPGNIRELRNMMQRAVVLGLKDELQLDDFPEEIRRPAPALSSAGPGTLDELERQRIVDALRQFAGNKKEAAAALGISRDTIYQKIKKYGIAEI